jgi:SAM-dependent methyltransferase
MMQGTREVFDYFECADCGCLQICSFPDDISAYYASDYYSIRHRNALKRYLFDQRLNAITSKRALIGRLLLKIYPAESNKDVGPPPSVKKTDRILEVGCGNGGYLFKLYELGYPQLHGIDPYMSPEDEREHPFPLERKSLLDLSPASAPFDVILMGHTLEHIAQQRETVKLLREVLSPTGIALIRIPMIPCYAWDHYGTDWVQLDAPRHFFLHTRQSLQMLADAADLKIDDIAYDSNSFQFWGSEQYRMDIPLSAPNSWSVAPGRSPFDAERIEQFEVQAMQLNREGRGDQVTIRLSRK